MSERAIPSRLARREISLLGTHAKKGRRQFKRPLPTVYIMLGYKKVVRVYSVRVCWCRTKASELEADDFSYRILSQYETVRSGHFLFSTLNGQVIG